MANSGLVTPEVSPTRCARWYEHPRMHQLFEPRVSLEAFAHFGDNGTPVGMIGSADGNWVSGEFGRSWRSLLKQLVVVAGGIGVGVVGLALVPRADEGLPHAEPTDVPAVDLPVSKPAVPTLDAPAMPIASERAKSSRSTNAGRASSGECIEVRRTAEQALRRGRWLDVERHTRTRHCWQRQSDRLTLRIRALFELERFDECLAVNVGTNRELRRLQVPCAKARGDR